MKKILRKILSKFIFAPEEEKKNPGKNILIQNDLSSLDPILKLGDPYMELPISYLSSLLS